MTTIHPGASSVADGSVASLLTVPAGSVLVMPAATGLDEVELRPRYEAVADVHPVEPA